MEQPNLWRTVLVGMDHVKREVFVFARSVKEATTPSRPGDSFLWYGERAPRLFGFHYTLEVYTPGHERTHGYHSLPIPHDGQLIGRIDPRVHRADRRLEVKWVHFEARFARGIHSPAAAWGSLDCDAALAGLAGSLHSLAPFVEADTVSLDRVSPSALSSRLRRYL